MTVFPRRVTPGDIVIILTAIYNEGRRPEKAYVDLKVFDPIG
jgi:hypothetical protein